MQLVCLSADMGVAGAGRPQQGSMLGARQNGLDGSVPLQQDSNPFGQLGSLPYAPAQNPVQSAFAAQPPQHQSEFLQIPPAISQPA